MKERKKRQVYRGDVGCAMHTHRWAGPLDTMKRKRASTVTKQRTRVFFFFSHALHQWLIFRLLSTANGGQLTGCPSTERESISYDSYVLLRVAVRPIHSQPYRREYKRPITNPLEVFSSLFPPFIRLLFATGKKSRRHSTGARTHADKFPGVIRTGQCAMKAKPSPCRDGKEFGRCGRRSDPSHRHQRRRRRKA